MIGNPRSRSPRFIKRRALNWIPCRKGLSQKRFQKNLLKGSANFASSSESPKFQGILTFLAVRSIPRKSAKLVFSKPCKGRDFSQEILSRNWRHNTLSSREYESRTLRVCALVAKRQFLAQITVAAGFF